MKTFTASLITLFLSCILVTPAFAVLPNTIDNFDYIDSAQAATAWSAQASSPDAQMVTNGIWGSDKVMVLPCDYGTTNNCVWDMATPPSLNLSRYEEISLRAYIEDPSVTLTLSFESGAGRYEHSLTPTQSGWTLLNAKISAFTEVGTPADLSNVTSIRLTTGSTTVTTEKIVAVRKLWAFTHNVLLDDFSYSDNQSAQQIWEIQKPNRPLVEMSPTGDWGAERVMKMPCGAILLPVDETRCYWDKSVENMDLSGLQQFAFNFYIDDPSIISNITFYLKSNGVWYGKGTSVRNKGWQTINYPVTRLVNTQNANEVIPLAALQSVDRIRLSLVLDPSKINTNTESYVVTRNLVATNPTISFLTKVQGQKEPDHSTEIKAMLDRYEYNYSVITDEHIEGGYLSDSKLLILSRIYESNLSTLALDNIESFVNNNAGKLISYSTLLNTSNSRLAKLLGMSYPGAASISGKTLQAYNITSSDISYLPSKVFQDPHANIRGMIPNANSLEAATVLALWEDINGNMTDVPAWLSNVNGAYFGSTELLSDFDTNAYLLTSLMGHYVPEIFDSVSNLAIQRISRIGEFNDLFDDVRYQTAVDNISTDAQQTTRYASVLAELDNADVDRNTATNSTSTKSEVFSAAWQAREHMINAYALSKKPGDKVESRAVWEHGGIDDYLGGWPRVINNLAENGFDKIIVNVAGPGWTHFPNVTLGAEQSEASMNSNTANQLLSIVDEAKLNDIEVHAWMLAWNAAGLSQSALDTMRSEKRLQSSVNTVDGRLEEEKWLTPCDSRNFELVKEQHLEMASRYNVHGIHLDFIRFLPNSSYDDKCKLEFENLYNQGAVISDWPAAVLEGEDYHERYEEYKTSLITQLVMEVKAGIADINAVDIPGKPKISLSAAVFRPSNSDQKAQDWGDWICNDYIDELYVIGYSANVDVFHEIVDEVSARISDLSALGCTTEVPIHIGISAANEDPGVDGVIQQINTSRERELAGFSVFEYSNTMANRYMPLIGSGITDKSIDRTDTDGDSLIDIADNCPLTPNPNQDDFVDGDGIGNVCDTDDDNDGLSDEEELALGIDGFITDPLNSDSDNDSFIDGNDCNPTVSSIYPGATEIALDGIDQDCDGTDLTTQIILATYKGNTLTVRALSDLPTSAILTVYGFGNLEFGNMKKNTKKEYWELKVRGIENPGSVTVTSSEGTTLPFAVQ